MLRSVRLCVVIVPALLCAQSETGKLTFEVATVKPAAPATGIAAMMSKMLGGPGTPDPGQITYTNVPMRGLLLVAYGFSQPYHIEGPPWMENEKYDIVAKVPAGATRDQLKEMLRSLLAERFQLKTHSETRDLPGYEVVVAKGGIKM